MYYIYNINYLYNLYNNNLIKIWYLFICMILRCDQLYNERDKDLYENKYKAF